MSKKDYHGNIAAEAWDETKAEADPEFAAIPELGFRENLEFRAAKVKETGIAITNFEKKVAEILSSEPKDPAPLAVVDSAPGVNLDEAAAEGIVERSPEIGAAQASEQASAAKSDADVKADADGKKSAKNASRKAANSAKAPKAAAKAAPKPGKAGDQSGHVPKGKEVKAIVREAATAPLK